jgi:UDP-N-acetylglucosamine 2-epimerase
LSKSIKSKDTIKIATVIGARPQFIKAASLSRYIKKISNSINNNLINLQEIIIHTGQHYDFNMNDTFFNELELPKPDYNLGIGSDTHARQTGRMMIELENILLSEKPDYVLIYGDTNSTIAGSLTAVKMDIPLAHVEAGLRSYDRKMPEEVNRVVSDTVSTLLFCPTDVAVTNLKKEGITKNVHNVGDIMLETYQYYKDKAEKSSKILKVLGLKPKKYFLCTIHRVSNTDNKNNLKNILVGLSESKKQIILPIHPRTKKIIEQNQDIKDLIGGNINIIDPIGYFDMIMLEKNARKIITDSGGVQKEAYFNKVPCITLRENTEWVETIHNGVNILAGIVPENITEAINNFLPDEKRFTTNLFGDGQTSAKIIKIISEFAN